jgi:hypothetical protein
MLDLKYFFKLWLACLDNPLHPQILWTIHYKLFIVTGPSSSPRIERDRKKTKRHAQHPPSRRQE